MVKLPDLEDLRLVSEGESSDISRDLNNTEQILKRLLINIEAFKRIEIDNMRLRSSLLTNHSSLKSEFKNKLDMMSAALKEKEAAGKKIKESIQSQYKKFSETLTKVALEEKQKNDILRKRYSELYLVTKKLSNENKNLKAVLMHNEGFLKRLNEEKERFVSATKEKTSMLDLSHKKLLRTHEETKIKLSQKLQIETRKNEFLKSKYIAASEALSKLDSGYRQLQKFNEKIMTRLNYLEKLSLANQDVLRSKNESMRSAFTEKLKGMARLQLNREVEYKAKIESLSKDLANYYEDLKKSKLRYYEREKRLKEKLKEILD